MFDFLVPKKLEHKEVTEKLIMDYCNTFLTNQLNEKEMKQFLIIAMTYQLNPFKREIYCVPYMKNEKMPDGTWTKKRALSIITGYETYLKKAYSTGLIEHWTTNIGEDKIDQYAEIIIKRKDWTGEFQHKVYLKEYRQDNRIWKTKPYTMLKKVVTAQGFRLCFPEKFDGLPYTADELPDDMTQPKEVTPKKEEKKKKQQGLKKKENPKGKEQKDEILAMARTLTKQIKTNGNVQYFIDLSKSEEDYPQEQYLLDFQYLQGLEKKNDSDLHLDLNYGENENIGDR